MKHVLDMLFQLTTRRVYTLLLAWGYDYDYDVYLK